MALKHYFNTVFKFFVFVLLCYVFYRQWSAVPSFEILHSAFLSDLSRSEWLLLAAAIFFMPLNWLLETLKWNTLLKPDVHLKLWPAFKAILSGVTVSLFTPNRTGEYAGRILLVEAQHNWKAAIASVMGSFAQILVLTGMGVLGAAGFLYVLPGSGHRFLYAVALSGLLPWLAALYLYFHPVLLLSLSQRLPLPKRLGNYLKPLNVISNWSKAQLGKVLVLALLRYLVYGGQYLLVLAFFGVSPSLWQGISGVATIFLLQTGIPLPPFGALLARGEIALMVWTVFDANEIAILAATFVLFIINLSLPALFGAIFIFKTNVLKSIGYDDKQEKE